MIFQKINNLVLNERELILNRPEIEEINHSVLKHFNSSGYFTKKKITSALKLLKTTNIQEETFVRVKEVEKNINLLFLIAVQQFNFWYDEKRPQLRTELTSTNLNKFQMKKGEYLLNYKEKIYELLDHAITLRKERFQLLVDSFEHFREGCNYALNLEERVIFYLKYLHFNEDYFKKKKNYFLMSILRYFRRESMDIVFDCNPAIDYNIPPILEELNLISPIKNYQLESGSYSEFKIRAESYLTMLLIAQKLEITNEDLDSRIFFNRHKFKSIKNNKILLCKTTSY